METRDADGRSETSTLCLGSRVALLNSPLLRSGYLSSISASRGTQAEAARKMRPCAGCRTRPITGSVYFCTECCDAIRRSMRRAPGSSPVEVRRLKEFARMVGAAALAEIAARDE